MITSISSSISTFKTVEFGPGLNLVVAGEGPKSGKGNTRNGRGKSALIEVINYCLGSSTPSGDRTLAKAELAGSSFTMDFNLRGNDISITRTLGEDDQVFLSGKDLPALGLDQDEMGATTLSIKDWRALLGEWMFNLSGEGWHPSFRSLIPYFVRDGREAYLSPERTVAKQSSRVIRPIHAFLFDLNWKRQHELEETKKSINESTAALKTLRRGLLDLDGLSASAMRAKQASLQERLVDMELRLAKFHVHENYEDIEAEANRITGEIHSLSQSNIGDRNLIERYRDLEASEEPPDVDKLERLYESVGILFPAEVKLSLEEAKVFHEGIVADRKRYLEQERKRLAGEIKFRTESIRILDSRRSELMSILETHGALAEYAKLQNEVSDIRDELGLISDRISIRVREDHKLANFKAKAAQIVNDLTLEIDSSDIVSHTSRIQKLFREASKSLYGRARGAMIFDVDAKGVVVNIERTDRAGSDGIESANLFCHDLVMTAVWAEKNLGPGFLVHDSRIFDPVDSRQRTASLLLANDWCMRFGFQYITTFNSDMLPPEVFKEGGLSKKQIALQLSDKGERGGLFGFLF